MQNRKAILIGRTAQIPMQRGAQLVQDFLEEHGYEREWINTADERDRKKLNEVCLNEAAVLISFDLAGFERSTQSGSFLYNILSCKSIHLVEEKPERFLEVLKDRKVSIALFFAGIDMPEGEEKRLCSQLPQVPWLKCCPLQKAELQLLLCQIFTESFLPL